MLAQRHLLEFRVWVGVLKEGLLPSRELYVIATEAVWAIPKLEQMAKQLLLVGQVGMDQT